MTGDHGDHGGAKKETEGKEGLLAVRAHAAEMRSRTRWNTSAIRIKTHRGKSMANAGIEPTTLA